MIAKSVSIKDAGGKSGGRVSKAVELIAGDLLHVLDLRLRMKQFILTLRLASYSGFAITPQAMRAGAAAAEVSVTA